MPWNNINQALKDLGLEGARQYLVMKKITQQHCVFHSGTFHRLRHSQQDYQLYILSHGCSDVAAITGGTDVVGQKATWAASRLARDLIEKGLPGDREARIKLCMCHSAEDIQSNHANPDLSGVFAQHLARALYSQGSGRNRFSNVYVGGFTVPVNWKSLDLRHVNQKDHTQYASRVYYRCDAAGTIATDAANSSGIRPYKATRSGSNVHRAVGGSKWIKEPPAPSAQAVKYAYFPFDYLPAR